MQVAFVSTVDQNGNHTGFVRKAYFDSNLPIFEGDIGLDFTVELRVPENITNFEWYKITIRAKLAFLLWKTRGFMQRGKVFFISGHLDLTQDEFSAHYVPQIEGALKWPPVSFVVGDARGADTLVQEYLKLRCADVVVYHMFEKPRNNPAKFKTKGWHLSDIDRDEAMTRDSTHDIAWVRPGRESSGTAKNLARRA